MIVPMPPDQLRAVFVPLAEARPTYISGTLTKGLRLLEALLLDGGRSTLTVVARRVGMPASSAHRFAVTLEVDGYIERAVKGVYVPGQRLRGLTHVFEERDRLAAEMRQPLARLARRFGAYGHAGILEENMVTYVVQERGDATDLFAIEQMQLEAYCSAIGKVLLAAMPDAELAAYLDQGPFVALTSNTITNPTLLKEELLGVRNRWVAYDRHEVRNDLYCVAVPLRRDTGEVRGAMSLSFLGRVPDTETQRLALRSLKDLANRCRRREVRRSFT